MKKKIILFLLITCFLGATLIPAVQADDPNYITYEEVMAEFRASLGCVEIFFHEGSYHAAPAQADYGGRIVPYWDGAFYRYQDAHIIELGIYFESETYKEAKFFDVNTELKFLLQGPNDDELVELPVLTTALTRRIIEWFGVVPNEGTGWRISYGFPFHQQELPIGEYFLVTEVYAFGELAVYIPCYFSIVLA